MRLSYGSWSRAGGLGHDGPVWRLKQPEAGGRAGSCSTDTRERRCCVLEAGVLVDQRLELRQSVVYLSALLVKEVSHDCVLFTGV